MKVYLDNAATTPLDEAVLKEMLPYMGEVFGNAASMHSWGREANKAVERARAQVAAAIGARADEIYFTSGATEANNWAVLGRKNVVISAIEHPSLI